MQRPPSYLKLSKFGVKLSDLRSIAKRCWVCTRSSSVPCSCSSTVITFTRAPVPPICPASVYCLTWIWLRINSFWYELNLSAIRGIDKMDQKFCSFVNELRSFLPFSGIRRHRNTSFCSASCLYFSFQISVRLCWQPSWTCKILYNIFILCFISLKQYRTYSIDHHKFHCQEVHQHTPW